MSETGAETSVAAGGGSGGQAGASGATSSLPRRRRRRRWVPVLVVTLAVAVTGGAVVLSRLSSTSSGAAVSRTPTASLATVQRSDLTQHVTLPGTLGYGAQTPLSGAKSGVITSLPKLGTVLTRGMAGYGVDAVPVPVFYGSLPFFRALATKVSDGPDVRELEENLQALGFDNFGTPDSHFDWQTREAVKKWQASLGIDKPTGMFSPGDVVLTAGPVRVAVVSAQLGGSATGAILQTTSPDRIVTAKLQVGQVALVKVGMHVQLAISGGGSTTGTVRSIDSGVQGGSGGDGSGGSGGSGGDGSGGSGGGGSGGPTIGVTISLDSAAAAGALTAAPVDISVTSATRQGVLAVPVEALLAVTGGGYAVEVDEQGRRRLLAVQLGLFSDGQVEVSGAGLQAGMHVVVAS